MKKLLLILFTIMFSISIYSCSSSSGSSNGSSIEGRWINVKEISIEEDGTYETIYNHEAENYYSAEILDISDGIIHVYLNDEGSEYISLNFPYSIKDNMLTISFSFDTLSATNTLYYSFEDGQFVIESREENEGFLEINKSYYKKYTGNIPPASWLSPLQNDSFEPDNTPSTSKPISIGSSAQTHTVTAGDEDWFKFGAVAGNKYLLLITGDMDNVITLFDTNQFTELAEDDDNDFGYNIAGNVESAIVWECTSSGEYFFRVMGYDDESDVGYYAVSVSLTSLAKTNSTLGKGSQKNKKAVRPLFLR